MSVEKHIPLSAVSRLSRYYRALLECGGEGYLSSGGLAELSGLNSAIVRRDLSYFGKFGVPGKGYPVSELRDEIFRILGIDRQWRIALIGLGNLGRALIRYRGFSGRGFNIVAVFDSSPSKTGGTVRGMRVNHPDLLKSETQKLGINMAIVTVPSSAADDVLGKVIGAGIQAILNFAPVKFEASPDVRIVNIDIGIELEKLSFLALHKKT